MKGPRNVDGIFQKTVNDTSPVYKRMTATAAIAVGDLVYLDSTVTTNGIAHVTKTPVTTPTAISRGGTCGIASTAATAVGDVITIQVYGYRAKAKVDVNVVAGELLVGNSTAAGTLARRTAAGTGTYVPEVTAAIACMPAALALENRDGDGLANVWLLNPLNL
tara:strand:- start:1 stop:489 length:489 start_codon:yes stop_codon:yes gene_type:complete